MGGGGGEINIWWRLEECVLGDFFLVGGSAHFWLVAEVSPIPPVGKTQLTHFTLPKYFPITDAVLKKVLLALEVSGLLTLPVLVFHRIAT